jgi:hypothetical protein
MVTPAMQPLVNGFINLVVVLELPTTEESFQMQEHMKITWHCVWAVGRMIELFSAKCRNEILRCGGSLWQGIFMKYHNTPTKYATSLFYFLFIRKHRRHPA